MMMGLRVGSIATLVCILYCTWYLGRELEGVPGVVGMAGNTWVR